MKSGTRSYCSLRNTPSFAIATLVDSCTIDPSQAVPQIAKALRLISTGSMKRFLATTCVKRKTRRQHVVAEATAAGPIQLVQLCLVEPSCGSDNKWTEHNSGWRWVRMLRAGWWIACEFTAWEFPGAFCRETSVKFVKDFACGFAQIFPRTSLQNIYQNQAISHKTKDLRSQAC